MTLTNMSGFHQTSINQGRIEFTTKANSIQHTVPQPTLYNTKSVSNGHMTEGIINVIERVACHRLE